MGNRDKIIEATLQLINEYGEHIEKVTVREICKRAGVGVGLISYHFGSRDALIEECVERIINGIVAKFEELDRSSDIMSPFEKLQKLGELTFSYLFNHSAISRISILSDMKNPSSTDNTSRTYKAYLPLVKDCRPNLTRSEVCYTTLCLISTMQSSFLRSGQIYEQFGYDLTDETQRNKFHRIMLNKILGENKDEDSSSKWL